MLSFFKCFFVLVYIHVRIYIRFIQGVVNTYIPIFQGLDAGGVEPLGFHDYRKQTEFAELVF